MEKRLLSVVGPTAIGKTSLAIALANFYGTEILSADSRQFYKEMRIGTAVPSEEELGMAKHHFVQHRSIFDPYSAGDFERDALSLLDQLFRTRDTVIMVGGSGLFIDAVNKGLDSFPKVDPKIREALGRELAEKGIKPLQNRLADLDPDYHAKVDLDNPHRLIRALEICIGTGKPFSSFRTEKADSRPFRTITIGMNAERGTVYDRIERRTDQMMSEGLLDEAERLYPHRHLNALRTVGYKELFAYFEGRYDLDFALSEIKKNTRRFAKRQLTWFRRDASVLWIAHDARLPEVLDLIKTQGDRG